ncbi:DNA polymerase zeta [Rhodosporidiobolus nylandii]
MSAGDQARRPTGEAEQGDIPTAAGPSAPTGPAGVSATAAPDPDCFIRFRLSAIDYVPSFDHSPYDNRRSPFSSNTLRSVPVVRVFGATDRGQRVMAHIHGAFPYVYVEYPEKKLDPESVNAYIWRFGTALNKAMALSFPSKDKDKGKDNDAQFVAFITICKGIPFYGYHVGYRPFLKVYCTNPRHIRRMGELLRSGAVLSRQFDVFEAHIPFLLNHVATPSDEYLPPSCDGPFATRLYTSHTVPPSRLHPSPDDGGPIKVSHEPLELDLPVSAILNRRRLASRELHHDFVEYLQPDLVPPGRKVASVKELWVDESRRRAARGDSGPFEQKDTAPREHDSRPSGAPSFRVEPGQRAKLARRLEKDLLAFQESMGARGGAKPDFATYVDAQEKMAGRKSGWLDMIKTAFEQVDSIYVERFEEDERTSYPFGAWAVKGIGLKISKEQEEAWRRTSGRGASVDVDLGRLRATQSANRAASSRMRAQAQQARMEGKAIEDDDDFGDSSAGSSDEDGAGGGNAPPTTQREMLERTQRRLQQTERRGRLGSTEEGEWEKDVEDEGEDDDYWGMDHGTDRAVSEASFGGYDSDDASSVASGTSSRPNSVSPVKRSYSSPLKPKTEDEESEGHPEPPLKRFMGADDQRTLQKLASQGGAHGQQAANFIVGPVSSPARPRASRSPTLTRTPSRRATASSNTPSRLPRANPFSSPDKAVAIRVAHPDSSQPTVKPPSSDADLSAALFTFHSPPVKPEATTPPEAAAPAPRPLARTASPPPLEHFLASSASSPESTLAPSASSRSALSPTRGLHDLADLPAGVLEDDYEPTPTVREDVPSQLPEHLRSSPHRRLALEDSGSDGDSDCDGVGGSTQVLSQPLRAASVSTAELVADDLDIEMDEAKPNLSASAPPLPVQQKPKRVAFQLARSDSEASFGSSQATTPTPVQPDAEGLTDTSQPTTDSETATRPQPPPRTASLSLSRRSFAFAESPPTSEHLVKSIESFKRSRVLYQEPFYSKPADVPHKKREYAGRVFRIKGSTISYMRPFEHAGRSMQHSSGGRPAPALSATRAGKVRTWEFAARPPTPAEAQDWLTKNGTYLPTLPLSAGQPTDEIEAATQKSSGGAYTSTKGSATREKQHMAVLSVELHVNTRGKLRPNPHEDEVSAIFYCLMSDNDDIEYNGRMDNTLVGVITVGDEYEVKRKLGNPDYAVEVVENEADLIEYFIEKVRYEWDPECFAGYEVHHSSWGYLLERAEYACSWNIVPELGRVKSFDTGKFGDRQSDRWGFNQASTLNFTGRHVLPIWRILKADNKLQQNSFEHIVWHVLHQRTPHLSYKTLTEWYNSDDPALFSRVFAYWRNRVELDMELLDAAEVIDQNWQVHRSRSQSLLADFRPSPSESARVFGVDFNSVRTRGSQFKVESVMFKIAKPESFMLLSPNRQQVGKQNAAECMPLIMEPKSAFYKGPLLVLDFQSLYPSVMIAYNYCYSTCLGRVEEFKGSYKLGVSESDLPDGLLYLLKDHITISPNGIMFLKPEVRKSGLAKMLSELLDTRVMVKDSMKGMDADKVTYGYTSATFSGRMPMVEIADAIVQTGRETLERAKTTIEANKEWGAEVVYGDTDSLFIYLPGKSKEDAFRIGYEMADKVTSQNPRPIKLKFEKVYLPCVLLAKKRYVGWKYEKLSQTEPDFDAKGIETVRRDGIPATQKIQEWCLKSLFRNADLSVVKEYLQRQWRKLEAGDVSPQDFTIAKEVKLGSYAEGRLPPPGAAVATRAMLDDPRAEPEYGERVPYLMFQAEPGQKQVHRAIHPSDFLTEPRLRLDATHYITRMIIPPLERIFNLLGVDVKAWYREMRKSKRVNKGSGKGTKAVMLDEHFVSDRCVACEGPDGNGGLCPGCRHNPSQAVYTLEARKQALLQRRRALHQICASCSATPLHEPIACDSYDCPNLYARVRNANELDKLPSVDSLAF